MRPPAGENLAATHDVLPISEERNRPYLISTIHFDRFHFSWPNDMGRGTVFIRLWVLVGIILSYISPRGSPFFDRWLFSPKHALGQVLKR